MTRRETRLIEIIVISGAIIAAILFLTSCKKETSIAKPQSSVIYVRIEAVSTNNGIDGYSTQAVLKY